MALELAFRARLPGNAPLQLHELDPITTDSDNGAAFRNATRCSPGVASPPWAKLQDTNLADWDTHANPSAATPTPSKRTTRNLGAHSDLLLPYGSGPGTSQPTRTYIPSSRHPPIGRPWFLPRRLRGLPTGVPMHHQSILRAHSHLPCPPGPSMGASPPSRIQPLSQTLLDCHNKIRGLDQIGPAKHSPALAAPHGSRHMPPPLDSDPDTRLDHPTTGRHRRMDGLV